MHKVVLKICVTWHTLQQEAQMDVQDAHKEKRSYLQALQECGGCVARCAAYQDVSPQFGAQLVGHPHLTPGHPSHHKGYNALPLQHVYATLAGLGSSNVTEQTHLCCPCKPKIV